VHALLFCQDHRVCELRKHFPFCLNLFYEDFSAVEELYGTRYQSGSFSLISGFTHCLHSFSFLYLRTFQQPNPFYCNRSATNLFINSFLSRTLHFFFFFLSLWIYLWLAEASQQPISQTTWLKVIPHCIHCKPFFFVEEFYGTRCQSGFFS
jgi:hypothetical protein